MPSLWSEVQLTYVLIMTVFLGIFRAIDIGLHSRDLHTAQSAHSALACNFPSESDAGRPKKAIRDAEFNTGGIPMEEKCIVHYDDQNAKNSR